MRKLAGAVAVVVVLAAGTFAAKGATSTDRPTGVSAKEWIAISDRFGFVILPSQERVPVAAPQGLMLKPAMSGYFMVKQASGWGRVVVVDPYKGAGDAG